MRVGSGAVGRGASFAKLGWGAETVVTEGAVRSGCGGEATTGSSGAVTAGKASVEGEASWCLPLRGREGRGAGVTLAIELLSVFFGLRLLIVRPSVGGSARCNRASGRSPEMRAGPACGRARR